MPGPCGEGGASVLMVTRHYIKFIYTQESQGEEAF